MNYLTRLRRTLSTKLALIVTLAVLLVLLALGVYFDNFLRANFIDVTSKRMQHAYQRLNYNLHEIESGLIEGGGFAGHDERLLASIDLINRYQDKTRYNIFLIDEEKKTLATELLDRVKLSLNSNIALYGQDEQLVAFVSRGTGGYRLSYVSYADGKPQVFSREERHNEFTAANLPAQGHIQLSHVSVGPTELQRPDSTLTYQRIGDALAIIGHQTIFDSPSGRRIAHLEIGRDLDTAYFEQLSRQMDVVISQSFQSEHASSVGQLDDQQAAQPLLIFERGDQYVSTLRKEAIGGPAYYSVALEKESLTGLINTHRFRFVILMLLVSAAILLLMHVVIRHRLTRPLAKLMDQIRRVEKGDYTASTQVATGDELEEISTSVNKLALAVAQRETSLERARNEQEYLSNHDSLTKLPNRRFFMHRLEHALDLARRNQTQLAILFMDLDQFKLVNDTLGHDVGDQLLTHIGARLMANARSSDTLARIGGDEFVVMIENVRDLAEIEMILSKFLALFYEPFACGLHEIRTTVSIGAAMYPRDGADSVTLLKNTDLAVYKAKDSGRDKYSFFSQEMAERANVRAETIYALKLAMESQDQFVLYYQAKVNAQSGKVAAAEALIRWHRPGFGTVAPALFIPLAEETGQIIAIGEWVIQQGCRDLVHIQKAGVGLTHLSMNVSNVQMHGRNLGQVLQSAIQKNGLSANQIELEITESYIEKDVAQAITTLKAFRTLGVQLAIDDFGTGYSSMSYLQKLPFTRMKIDKSFIDRLPHDQDSVSITRAILGLAKNFGLAVTAEGVERADQLQFLQQEGCDEIQGYYFAKPMPLDAFVAYCRQNQSA